MSFSRATIISFFVMACFLYTSHPLSNEFSANEATQSAKKNASTAVQFEHPKKIWKCTFPHAPVKKNQNLKVKHSTVTCTDFAASTNGVEVRIGSLKIPTWTTYFPESFILSESFSVLESNRKEFTVVKVSQQKIHGKNTYRYSMYSPSVYAHGILYYKSGYIHRIETLCSSKCSEEPKILLKTFYSFKAK